MSLKERLNEDMKAAMRSGDHRRRDVIRYLRAAMTNAEIEKRSDLDDSEIEALIRTQVKQRRDSIDMFRAGGRDDLAVEEEAQLSILQEYQAAQLKMDELEEIVRRIANDLSVSTPRDMARLMPALIAETDGRAEGRVLSQLARAELERRAAELASS